MNVAVRVGRLAPIAVLVALLMPTTAVVAKDKEPNFIQKALQGVTLGKGEFTRELVIFPLIAAEKPPELDVKPNTATGRLQFAEPDFPKKRYNVTVDNGNDKPVLIQGGTVLVGGERDRLVLEDFLVPANTEVEFRTIPAASTSDRRDEPTPFNRSWTTAPSYLRERAIFNPSSNLVPIFVTHYLGFRNDKDKRKSLEAINESEMLSKYCAPCHAAMAEFPNANEGRVVGFVSAVRGRIHSLELFGSNRFFKAYFDPNLKSLTYAAAAIALKAKKYGIPIPGKDNPEETLEIVTEKANKLISKLMTAKFKEGDVPKGAAGDLLLVRANDGSRGLGIGSDGRLIHLAIFPHDPFESRLYSKALKLPPEAKDDDYDPYSYGNLEVRSRTGARLTEFEKRYLGRRRSQPGIGGFGGPKGGGRGGRR